jgi:hypothetical protein
MKCAEGLRQNTAKQSDMQNDMQRGGNSTGKSTGNSLCKPKNSEKIRKHDTNTGTTANNPHNVEPSTWT